MIRPWFSDVRVAISCSVLVFAYKELVSDLSFALLQGTNASSIRSAPLLLQSTMMVIWHTHDQGM